MHRIGILLFILIPFAACSSRVVYDPPAIDAVSPGTVNINAATVDELERLPRIGRKTAEAIVEFRTANGPFHRTEQLLLLRGMSEKHFLEIRQYLSTD